MKKNILIVDDHADFATGTAMLLAMRGCEVQLAGSLLQARRVVATYPDKIDAALIDFMLPDGCGMELLDLNFPRVVLITGHAGVNSYIEGFKGKNIIKLTKPVTIEQIVEAIEGTAEDDTLTGLKLRDIEKRAVLKALKTCNSKVEAAKQLGISLNTLYNRLASYGISPDSVCSNTLPE